ncbi:hypothetical protein [Sporosarcina psychrophila]|uniref:Uncharacterized protein n=1 Tax=Sporosarcina psychrophila TaxID=1476 RepID=A0ABV2KBM0_SPOPS
MKVVQTVFTGNCWRSGEDNVDQRVEVALIDDEGLDVMSVGFSEGEPEDMTLNRDLNDAYSIADLVEKVYELGRGGVVVTFESNTEEY